MEVVVQILANLPCWIHQRLMEAGWKPAGIGAALVVAVFGGDRLLNWIAGFYPYLKVIRQIREQLKDWKILALGAFLIVGSVGNFFVNAFSGSELGLEWYLSAEEVIAADMETPIYIRDIEPVSGGGAIVTYHFENNHAHEMITGFEVVLLDESGKRVWNPTFTQGKWNVADDIMLLGSGDFFVAGRSKPAHENVSSAFFKKIAAADGEQAGGIKLFDGPYDSHPILAKANRSEVYLVYSQTDDRGQSTTIYVKFFDTSQERVSSSEKIYEEGKIKINAAMATTDGGLLLSGSLLPFRTGASRAWARMYQRQGGKLIWAYDEPSSDSSSSAISAYHDQQRDVIVMTRHVESESGSLVEILGLEDQFKNQGGQPEILWVTTIFEHPNGHPSPGVYIGSGSTAVATHFEDDNSSWHIELAKLNKESEVFWRDTIALPKGVRPIKLRPLIDGGVLIGAINDANKKKAWVAKYHSKGEFCG